MIQMKKKSFLAKQGALTQACLDVSCCSECGTGGGRVGECKRGEGRGCLPSENTRNSVTTASAGL